MKERTFVIITRVVSEETEIKLFQSAVYPFDGYNDPLLNKELLKIFRGKFTDERADRQKERQTDARQN